jgi:ferredoxin/flavodoxin---NADP+ reductase
LPRVPFDDRSGVIPNEGGRVIDGESGQRLAGEYVVGWIKRGPSGVIGTNKKDAQETVDAIFADLQNANGNSAARHSPAEPDAEAVERLLRERQPQLVTYEGWEAIDRHEKALGESAGRPRVKVTSIDEMLRIAAGEKP